MEREKKFVSGSGVAAATAEGIGQRRDDGRLRLRKAEKQIGDFLGDGNFFLAGAVFLAREKQRREDFQRQFQFDAVMDGNGGRPTV